MCHSPRVQALKPTTSLVMRRTASDLAKGIAGFFEEEMHASIRSRRDVSINSITIALRHGLTEWRIPQV